MESAKTRFDQAHEAFLRGDYVSARNLCELLIATGSRQAVLMLASIYEYGGAHVSQDYAKAKELYERAWNEWRLVLAAQKLGRFYYHGHGVKADYDRAFYYYSKLENSIDAVGLLSLGWLYETGRGVTSDINRARDLYRRSARLGNIQARKHWGFLEIKHGHPVFGIILWAWAIVEGVLAAFIKAKHGRLQSY